jgi:hypothetical protein
MRRALVTSCLCLLGLSACSGKKSDAEQRIADKVKKAEEDAKAREKSSAEKQAIREAAMSGKPPPTPAGEVVKVDPPYGDDGNAILRADGECPPGFWALFNDQVPGADKDEKKANAAKKAELARGLREKTYLVKFRAPADVKLSPYDAPNGRFNVDVVGSIDCTDSIGHVTIAWTKAVATTPPPSAAQEGAEVTQNIWMAPPVQFQLPMPTMAQAKEFNDKNRLTLSARVALKLGKVEVDKKMKKVAKVETEAAGQKLSMGGGNEDWGAGRLVRAELIGVRLASDREKTTVAEKKGP